MPAAGRGWAAAGDAAAAFDPLSSLGIGHAISSGIHAARVAHVTLCDTGDPADSYSSGVERVARDYLTLRRRYYAVEQRWPAQPFWARRQG
jgi:flavin-dependent dehydrogenase